MRWKIIAFKWNSHLPCSDRLIFFNPSSNKFDEVPGGAPHGYGFTINEVFHRVHEGQDITELVDAYAKSETSLAGFFKKNRRKIQENDQPIDEARNESEHLGKEPL